MRKGFVFVIAAAAVLLSTSGAATRAAVAPFAASARDAAAPSGSATLALPTDPGALDPQMTLVGAARYVDGFLYDTLVNLVGPGKVQSGLAQTWKVVSPKRVQFTLRRGITCSDGTRLTASIVKRNLDFVGDPANKSPLLGVFMPIGAKTVASDKARTVVVTTSTPSPFMIQGLAFVHIICPKGLADRSSLGRGASGSGPYTLTSVVPGDHYTLTVRKGYTWGPGGATTARSNLPAKVTLRVITNESTAANLILTGGINLVSLSGPDRARLDKARLSKKTAIGAPLEYFINQNPGHPGANPAVRKALVQALNLNQIGQVAVAGLGVRMTQLTRQDLTPCAGNSVAGSVPAFNPQAARSALAGVSVKLLYPTDAGPTFGAANELAQQQLSAAGVKVTLDAQSTAALSGKIFGTGDWDVVFIGIGVANPSQLTSLLSGATPPNGTNFAGIKNAGYQRAVASAVRRVGPAGCKFWLDAERALFRAGDVAPMSVFTTAFYGKGLTFALGPAGPFPTSLRLTK
jgi:peptide/nickel transport system substrate-binding protein